MPKIFFFTFLILNYLLAQAQVQIDTSIILDHVPRITVNKTIMIDGAHNNLHRAHTGFRPTALVLKKMGFEVIGNDQKFYSFENLKGIHILVIANPIASANRGRPVVPIFSAFEPLEINCLENWVRHGGKLILIADHMPFAGAMDSLANIFGIKYENGFVDGQTERWPPRTFRARDNNLTDAGLNLKSIDSVSTFTGSALKLPPHGNPILSFSGADTITFTDTAWVFSPNLKMKSLDGYVQGGIVRHGKGVVAAFGEAAMFTAQKIMPDGIRVGINSELAGQNIAFIEALMKFLLVD